MNDVPTAEFENATAAKALLSDLLELYKLYPGPTSIVFWRKESPQSYKPEHQKWLDALVQNRVSKVKSALIEMGIPKAMVTAKVLTLKQQDHIGFTHTCKNSDSGVYVDFDLYEELNKRTAQETVKMARAQNIVKEMGKGLLDYNPSLRRIVLLEEVQFKVKKFYANSSVDASGEFASVPEANQILEPVAELLKLFQVPVKIVFCCKEAPKDDGVYKDWLRSLSWNRAELVKKALIVMGVPGSTLSIKTVARESEVQDVFGTKVVKLQPTKEVRRDPSPGGKSTLLSGSPVVQERRRSQSPLRSPLLQCRSSKGSLGEDCRQSPPVSPLLLNRQMSMAAAKHIYEAEASRLAAARVPVAEAQDAAVASAPVSTARKLQARAALQKAIAVTSVDDIDLVEDAIHEAMEVGFVETRVDMLLTKAEDTLQRLRRTNCRQRARHQAADHQVALARKFAGYIDCK
jgi:hypothetical protein